MSVQLVDSSGKDDLKTQFITREGEYRLMTLSEYSRPNRVGYQNNQSNPQVRVSLVTLPSSQVAQQQAATVAGSSGSAAAASNGIERQENATSGSGGGSPGCSPPVGGDRICFNYGKELYVYAYRGVKKASDLSKPIDKKLYKGTNPSCHDFNATNATYEGAPLLVGFSTGQIQLVYPGRREQGKLYNEERLIDKTKVTCLKWIPGSEHQFLASHASGCMYMYNEELQCTPTTPSYQPYKCGDGYIVLACKSKSTRNPLYKWCFGQQENASINEFCFSPCGQHLAIVSQDGFLRVFHYSNMELIGIARSYFGGFLCVCWSPDGKYVVVGGEDDLVTVYSLQEQRVVARGQGHRSWVSVVSFDPYTTSYSNWESADFSDDDNPINDGYKNCYSRTTHSNSEATATAVRRPPSTYRNSVSTSDKLATSYRLGSVSQDTQLCLWDITEDVLRQSIGRLSRNLSSADPALCNTKSEFSNSANNSNSGQQASSQKDAAKTIAKTASMNDNDTVDNAVFNIKNITSNSLSTTINCDDSNNSNSSGKGSTNSVDGKHSKSHITKANSVTSSGSASTTTGSFNKKDGNSDKNSKSEANHHHHHSAFNSITQRLTNFSFGNNGSNNSDKNEKSEKSSKSSSSKRNIISLTGKSNNSNNIHNSSNNNHFQTSSTLTSNSSHANNNVDPPISNSSSSSGGGAGGGGGGISNTITSIMTSSLTKNKRGGDPTGTGNSIVSSYDPMKLIGTPACPRFDDCPVLEPLVCKKIAHERLTALIFREDCFLTACQDGFVYTWARPGYINLPQHLPPSPTAPPGGTVV
ncbi:wd-repeat protein [Culex quinquefasciatus]|uniref:Wd-repeat protein n=1 Tax=Culex quinquefasciatus TaxID=7176 RepID=B0XIY9_CULQU|nr:wd-repeat protein [Culex quinquefasciatus]|eukprot:XP_001869611.1 wd-repeat protein [Culex quinquefasciatus]